MKTTEAARAKGSCLKTPQRNNVNQKTYQICAAADFLVNFAIQSASHDLGAKSPTPEKNTQVLKIP